MKWIRDRAPLFGLALLGVGAGLLWSWALAAVVVGGLIWLDAYVPDDLLRPRR